MAPNSYMSAPVKHIFDVERKVGNFDALAEDSDLASTFCALLRTHQEEVSQRFQAFLAHEEEVARQMLKNAAQQMPMCPQKKDPKDESKAGPSPRSPRGRSPRLPFRPVSEQGAGDHMGLFDDKEFAETEWRPKLATDVCSQRVIAEITNHHHHKHAHKDIHDGTTRLQDQALRLVSSKRFDAALLSVIIVNSIVIGLEVEFELKGSDQATQGAFNGIQIGCNIIFLFELMLRLFADRCFFFYSDDWAWNWFDLSLVTFSTVELFLQLLNVIMGIEVTGAETFATARILRILRISRIAKTVRFVRALRVLLNEMMSTLRTVIFALVLLTLVIYFHAVILTQAVSSHLKESNEPELERHWGSILQSMLTLFLCITSGVDWSLALDPLLSISAVYGIVLIIYVTIMQFAVMNAITGSFCQAAVESQQHDEELQLHDLIENKKTQLLQLATILERMFDALDGDGSGEVDMKEFTANIQNESVQELLETLDLEPEDAWAFFRLLDKDASGSLDLDEFVKGCLQLKGTARSIDLAKTLHDLKVTRKQNHLFMQFVADQFQELQAKLKDHTRL